VRKQSLPNLFHCHLSSINCHGIAVAPFMVKFAGLEIYPVPTVEFSEYVLKLQRKGILEHARRIAVVGLKPEPIFKSYGRTQKLIQYGLSIFPVIPNCPTFFSIPCHESLHDITEAIDIVQVYPDVGVDLMTVALEAVQQHAKVFWVEDHQAPEAVRKVLAEAQIYLVEFASLEREYREQCFPQRPRELPLKTVVCLRVSERMTRNPVTVKSKERISDALAKMKEGHFRHLPVIDDSERLAGMLSDRDLRLIYPSSAVSSCEQIMEQLASSTVEQAAVSSPVAVSYDAPLEEAARLMLHWHVGALPVISGDSHLVGIITYTDLLEEFLARSNPVIANGHVQMFSTASP
jgi:CBS domain-containing protein/predicted CoA-binding protein